MARNITQLPARLDTALRRLALKVVPLEQLISKERIFVIGHQKSGTTAIAALLARAAGTTATLDLNKPETLPLINYVYNERLPLSVFVQSNAVNFTRHIIKEPELTFIAPQLEALFPRSRFVFVVRDPRETIRSILDRLSLPGELDELPEQRFRALPWAWRDILDAHWLPVEDDNYVGKLAQRWCLAYEAAGQVSSNVIVVNYESFCEDKANTIRDLAERLSLPWRDISGLVDDAYQPRGANRGVAPDEFFSPENLERISRWCGAREVDLSPGTKL